MTVALRPVTAENVRAVCELRLADGQERFVAPAAYTIAEGNYEPAAMLRAIYLGEEPVGVLCLVVEPSEAPFLVRFMVDAAHQGRGIGQRAFELLADELRQGGETSLETSCVPLAGGAEGFWRRCGFEDTGRETEGEPIFAITLQAA